MWWFGKYGANAAKHTHWFDTPLVSAKLMPY
jgi:hypothetical protein